MDLQALSKDAQLSWKQITAKYSSPDWRRSMWQTLNSLIPYFILWGLMYQSLAVSYWLTIALAIPSAGFLTRIFIISHDCGHGAFFKSKKANSILGSICSVMIFTPYHRWRHEHAIHHASAGNLDGRGLGDIWTLTVKEFQEAPRWTKFYYRFYRNPVVMFTIGPLFIFLIKYRFTRSTSSTRERNSNNRTKFALLGIFILISLTIGIKAFILIQAPIFIFSSATGVWLFYVQHQFEGVYWERKENWDYVTVALEGSSFYKLPKILQWFSGNIGFHHIHHLSPRIPNYFLEKCHKENSIFHSVKQITLWSSLKSITYRLWDEENRKMVHFRYLRKIQPSMNAAG